MSEQNGREEGLAELRAAGASAAQIHRWRKRGLVSCLRQVGRGRGKGSDSVYPEGTSRLVGRLIELLAENRNIEQATLRLWLEGHDVVEAAHQVLMGSAVRWERGLENLGERFDRVVSGKSKDPIPLPRGLGWMRQRLQKHYFLLVQVVVGASRGQTTTIRDPDEVKAFRRLIDESARHFEWQAPFVSAIKEDVAGLEGLANTAADVFPRFTKSIKELSDATLAEVREDTVALAKLWGVFEDGRSQGGIVGLLFPMLIVRLADFSFFDFASHSENEAVQSLLTEASQHMLSTGVLPWKRAD